MDNSKMVVALVVIILVVVVGGAVIYFSSGATTPQNNGLKLFVSPTGTVELRSNSSVTKPNVTVQPSAVQLPTSGAASNAAGATVEPGTYKIVSRDIKAEKMSSDGTSGTSASEIIFVLISPSDNSQDKAQALAEKIGSECQTAGCIIQLFDDQRAIEYQQFFVGMTPEKMAAYSPEELQKKTDEFQNVMTPFLVKHSILIYSPSLEQKFQYRPWAAGQ